jgi:transposase-like protein
MPRTRNPYPAEFREQIVALARIGRGVEDLAEFVRWWKENVRDRGRPEKDC